MWLFFVQWSAGADRGELMVMAESVQLAEERVRKWIRDQETDEPIITIRIATQRWVKCGDGIFV